MTLADRLALALSRIVGIAEGIASGPEVRADDAEFVLLAMRELLRREAEAAEKVLAEWRREGSEP